MEWIHFSESEPVTIWMSMKCVHTNYWECSCCVFVARYIFEWTSMNWADANAYCKATYGSQLATITSDEELAEARSAISDGGSVWAWIGLSKLSGSWEWASEQRCDYDGIRDCEDDPRWRKSTGEPNGWGNNNCAYVAVGHLYNDMPCSSGAPVLCDAGTVIHVVFLWYLN